MKKIISQISLIILIICIGTASVFINQTFAATSINCVSSIDVGGTITVSLSNFPAGMSGYNCNVKITYSDGSTASGEIAYFSEFTNNKTSVSFPAKVAGNATITVSNLTVSDKSGNTIESVGTKTHSVTIKEKTKPTEPPKENTTKPDEPAKPDDKPNDKPTTPTNNTTSDTSNKNNVNTNTNKDPEVKNPTFKDVNEKVYALKNCNVRSSCSTSANNKIGGLQVGEQVTRTGVSSEWSRITYNGKTAYVASNLLTTKEPEDKNEVDNEVTNEVVENEIDENQIELDSIRNEIGVLPEVGNNIAVELYFIVTVFAIAIVSGSLYYINKKK